MFRAFQCEMKLDYITVSRLLLFPLAKAGTPERGCITGALPPLTFERGGNGGTGALTCQYYKYSNFMIYQDQFEANLSQLFAHT